jgi:hypothetical protein
MGADCGPHAQGWATRRWALAGPPAGGEGTDVEAVYRARRCDLPERDGHWLTVCERLSRWRREGLFGTILDRLRLKLNAEGLSDLDLWCIDSTSVRASRSAAGTRKKGIHRSPTTIRSTSRVAASAPRSTCGAMVRACRSALRSRPGRGTRCWCSNRLRR